MADKNRPSQGGSRRVTPKSTPSTKGRRIRSRDVLVVALLTAGLLAGLVMAVGASMLVERTERGDAMFMAMATRHAQHILDLEAIDLLT